jgi:hypothetical protein
MNRSPDISVLLKLGGFSLHSFLGRTLRVEFPTQCWIIALVSAAVLLLASAIDRTLVLSGRDVGLLQHPAIWAFLALQIALPLSLRHSLRSLSKIESTVSRSARDFRQGLTQRVVSFVRLRESTSRSVATLCYLTGLIAFVWNSYQNQLPGIIVPYDFWDSSNHVWGYWMTRVYKLYLFVWFLPYIALVQAALLIEMLRLIRERRNAGTLTLQPFHPDGVGGLGFVPGIVTTPIIVTLLVAAIPVAAAFEVHRAMDVTPLMGATIVIVSALAAYLVPILRLRTDIKAMKRQMIEHLRQLQQDYYVKISHAKEVDYESLRRGNEALDYFDKVCARVNAISNYPHLVRLLKYVALALTPSAASAALKAYETLGPVILRLLKTS